MEITHKQKLGMGWKSLFNIKAIVIREIQNLQREKNLN